MLYDKERWKRELTNWKVVLLINNIIATRIIITSKVEEPGATAESDNNLSVVSNMGGKLWRNQIKEDFRK